MRVAASVSRSRGLQRSPQSAGDFDVERIKAHSRAAGVHQYVYASVGSAHRETGIPHFENKARVEERVRGAGEPANV